MEQTQDWVRWGTHIGPEYCSYSGPLVFGPSAADGFPNWERHKDGGTCQAPDTLHMSKTSDQTR